MTRFRFIPFAVALATAGALTGCGTAPAVPVGTAAAGAMSPPGQMAAMDAQMKTMRDMHDRMMNARSPEERGKLMAGHMKAMQDGMAMMDGMSGDGKGMQGMAGDMGARHQTMEKRMEMMQAMMKMMMDRMPAAPGK